MAHSNKAPTLALLMGPATPPAQQWARTAFWVQEAVLPPRATYGQSVYSAAPAPAAQMGAYSLLTGAAATPTYAASSFYSYDGYDQQFAAPAPTAAPVAMSAAQTKDEKLLKQLDMMMMMSMMTGNPLNSGLSDIHRILKMRSATSGADGKFDQKKLVEYMVQQELRAKIFDKVTGGTTDAASLPSCEILDAMTTDQLDAQYSSWGDRIAIVKKCDPTWESWLPQYLPMLGY